MTPANHANISNQAFRQTRPQPTGRRTGRSSRRWAKCGRSTNRPTIARIENRRLEYAAPGQGRQQEHHRAEKHEPHDLLEGVHPSTGLGKKERRLGNAPISGSDCAIPSPAAVKTAYALIGGWLIAQVTAEAKDDRARRGQHGRQGTFEESAGGPFFSELRVRSQRIQESEFPTRRELQSHRKHDRAQRNIKPVEAEQVAPAKAERHGKGCQHEKHRDQA